MQPITAQVKLPYMKESGRSGSSIFRITKIIILTNRGRLHGRMETGNTVSGDWIVPDTWDGRYIIPLQSEKMEMDT